MRFGLVLLVGMVVMAAFTATAALPVQLVGALSPTMRRGCVGGFSGALGTTAGFPMGIFRAGPIGAVIGLVASMIFGLLFGVVGVISGLIGAVHEAPCKGGEAVVAC